MAEIRKQGSEMMIPPKNIRQIGVPGGRHKIYIEDYVSTYLHSKIFRESFQQKAAVLLGKTGVYKEVHYTFISGAISCEELVFQDGTIQFHEKCWSYINSEIKKFFPQLTVIGWFLGVESLTPEVTHLVESTHRKYFVGRDKIMMLSEFIEGEDIFYTYEQGTLQKKEGYYIYYEKNMAMQEYMVSAREKLQKNRLNHFSTFEQQEQKKQENHLSKEVSIEHREEITAAEEALRNYRSLLLERGESKSQKRMSTLLYTAASAAMIVLCVIGITTVNNYEKMKNVEETLQVMSGNSVTATVEKEVDTGEILIESIPGGVEKQEENEIKTEVKTGISEENTEETIGEIKTNPEEVVETVESTIETETSTINPEVVEPEKSQIETQETSVEGDSQVGTEIETNLEGATTETGTSGMNPENATETGTNIIASGNTTEMSTDVMAVAKDYLEQGFYEVQPGDKLENICMKIYQTTAIMDKICQVNEIQDTDKIYAGQKLILP